jgi:parallel beta-helix repeat protein
VHQEEEPMQAIRRTASVVLFPTIACLFAACEQTGLPTEPQSTAGVVSRSYDLNAAANGTTRWVNDDDPNGGIPGYASPGTSCNDPGYPTIQSAVTASGPGDRINVCPGTYTEQVTIPAGKDNLLLRSVTRWEAIIKAPSIMLDFKAIVRVSGAQNVTILAFTISGPGGGPCDFLRYGVRVDGGGSANILGNHITQIRDNPLSGCQNGVGVQVGRQVEGTSGSAQIIGNVIDNYQKNGMTVDNAGSSAEIAHNRVLGNGPIASPGAAQNGIQVSRGATANVQHNFVAQNIFTTPAVASATGILLFQSANVTTEHNTVTSNDNGIYDWMATGSTTTNNHVRASNYDGVTEDQSSSARVANNMTEHSAGAGIGMYTNAHDNVLDANHASDNSGSGIVLDQASNNTVSNNQVRDNGTDGADVTDGIRVSAVSTGNTISKNHMKHNVTHDCHDDSGVPSGPPANVWTDNHGDTENRPGLCDGQDDDAAFAMTAAYGWDPSYDWSTAFGEAADFDWATAYATIDTDSLLQLLPSIRVGVVRAATLSPAP